MRGIVGLASDVAQGVSKPFILAARSNIHAYSGYPGDWRRLREAGLLGEVGLAWHQTPTTLSVKSGPPAGSVNLILSIL